MIIENNSSPNYNQIFKDILNKKFAFKKNECENLLSKNELSAIDIIELNRRIFGISKVQEEINQRHRSYSKKDILKILDYQKKHHLNNSQLANHFNLSRNTIAKWKKLFQI